MPLALNEVFPDEDYRFHLTLRKGSLHEFFGPRDPAILAQREHWLTTEPEKYTAALPDSAPMLEELQRLAEAWFGTQLPGQSQDPWARALTLGQELEPDFMLLHASNPGQFQLKAGVVCFPSSWNPAEKFGLGLNAIHGVVPRLNPSLGATIGQFLQKLKPGVAFERANWGLAATPELNMHPDRRLPKLTLPLDLNKIWVRIEDQILATLPESHALLFGIKLRILPLAEMLSDNVARQGFSRGLQSMPDDVATYKGLAEIRESLLRAIRPTDHRP